MKELYDQAFDMYQAYKGNSWFFTLFFLCLLYLYMTEEKKGMKMILIYLSLAIFVFFFFPPFIYVMQHVFLDDSEVYYRTIWLLPLGTVIAYGAAQIILRQKKLLRKWAAGLSIMVLIVMSGTYVYHNPYFSKTQNIYQLPQVVIDICDEIQVEGREVRAVFPAEILQYVRQYTPYVLMPYGREILVERWENVHPLYNTMQSDPIDTRLLAEEAKQYECAYIILNRDKSLMGSLAENGFEYVTAIGNYDIYVDPTIYLGL